MPPPSKLAAVSLLALLALACRTRPAPDPDGVAPGAGRLELGRARSDQLDCGVGDCQDWYRVQVGSDGRAFVEVRAVETAPWFQLHALSGEQVVASASGRGARPVRVEWPTAPGEYRIALVAESPLRPGFFARLFGAPRPRPWTYTLESRIERRPPPPVAAKPSFRALRSEVLEVESRGEILISAGTAQGVRPGDRGTLLNQGRAIGEIEIVAVYAEGSRAKVSGARGEQITPATQVEIRIPERR